MSVPRDPPVSSDETAVKPVASNPTERHDNI